MKKKVFSILLVLIMILTLNQNSAYAIDNVSCVKQVENLGIVIPNRIKKSGQAEKICKNMLESAKNNITKTYNNPELARLFNDINKKVNIKNKLNTYSLLSYTLQDSTPRSGWDDSYNNYRCYGYAIDHFSEIMPGDISGREYVYTTNVYTVANLVAYDLHAKGYSQVHFYKYSELPSLSSLDNVICLRISTADLDYHFMDYYESRWVHKPGHTIPLTWKYSSPNYKVWTNECIGPNGPSIGDITYDTTVLYISYSH